MLEWMNKHCAVCQRGLIFDQSGNPSRPLETSKLRPPSRLMLSTACWKFGTCVPPVDTNFGCDRQSIARLCDTGGLTLVGPALYPVNTILLRHPPEISPPCGEDIKIIVQDPRGDLPAARHFHDPRPEVAIVSLYEYSSTNHRCHFGSQRSIWISQLPLFQMSLQCCARSASEHNTYASIAAAETDLEYEAYKPIPPSSIPQAGTQRSHRSVLC